jgi:hypothetical protein
VKAKLLLAHTLLQQYTPGACDASQLALIVGAFPLVHDAGGAGGGTGQSPVARCATLVGPGGVNWLGNEQAGGAFATSTALAVLCFPDAVILPLLHSTPAEVVAAVGDQIASHPSWA